jgi:hypothetical protein
MTAEPRLPRPGGAVTRMVRGGYGELARFVMSAWRRSRHVVLQPCEVPSGLRAISGPLAPEIVRSRT